VKPGVAERRNETVLLAEDDDSLRDLVREMLESEGYRVLTASSGPEALRVAEAEPGAIDILVTDVVMPAMGGNQLAEFLRARRPGLRILFVSGYSAEAIEHRGVLLPGTQLLAKPFTATEFARRVREVLDGAAPVPPAGAAAPRPGGAVRHASDQAQERSGGVECRVAKREACVAQFREDTAEILVQQAGQGLRLLGTGAAETDPATGQHAVVSREPEVLDEDA
jgi:DNA-binding response OmpR family regulator